MDERGWDIRSYNVANDETFLLDSWLNAYRASPWAGAVPNNKYFDVYGDAIKELLTRGSKVLVACNPDNSSQILGWVCYELSARGDKVVHFVYVKDVFRKLGIANSLIGAAGINPKGRFYYTYKTKMSKVFKLAAHEPAIARRVKA